MTEITLHLPGRTLDDLAAVLETITEHIYNKDAGRDQVNGILGGRFGYGAEWDSPVFEMHQFDADADCDCGMDEVRDSHAPRYPHKRFATRTRRRRWYREMDANEARFPCHLTCTAGRPNFWHKPSGLMVRWYKYIGRSMEVTGTGDLAAILAACIADVAAPPFEPYVYVPPTDEEADKIMDRWAKEAESAMRCDHDMATPTDGLCPGCMEPVNRDGAVVYADDDIPF